MRILLIAITSFLSFLSLKKYIHNKEASLHHLVFIWLKDIDQASAIIADAKSLKHIPNIIDFRVGKVIKSDRPIVEDSYHLVLSMKFHNQESLDAYLVHPTHQAFTKRLMPKVSQIKVFDFLDI